MYEVIKKVIESKRYELSDILTKIDTLWVQGSITDEQKGRLVQLARENANVQNSINVMAKLEEMNNRLTQLEAKVKTMESDSSSGDSTDEEAEESVPAYAAGTWYKAGDKVTFDGNTYVCTAPDGVTCVWSPSEYPDYWQIEE